MAQGLADLHRRSTVPVVATLHGRQAVGPEPEVFGPSPKQHGVRRDGAHSQNGRQDHQRRAPTLGLDEPARQRDEDGAGEAGHERDHGERADTLTLEPARGSGKRRVVQRGGHHQADRRPDQIQLRQIGDLRPGQHQQRRGHRSDRHQQARSVAIQPSADGDRRQAGQEHRQ